MGALLNPHMLNSVSLHTLDLLRQWRSVQGHSLRGYIFPIMQIPTTSGTVAIAIPALALTAAQTTALASVAALGIGAKLAGIGIGAGVAGLGAALLSGSSRRSSRRRGKRYAEEEEDLSLETFANLEVEDCYKRVICIDIIGWVENPPLTEGHEV